MAAALRISMLLLLSLLASAPVLAVPAADLLPAAPWAPSAKCQAAADAACNANHSEFGPTVDHGHSCFVDIRSRPCDGPMVARKGHSAAASGPALWRCYSPSTLDANRSRFVKGDCFCSLDPQLRSLLAKCGSPDPTPPPAPPPPPAPHPPAAGGIAVFTSGQDDYHTYRIPAVVAHPADGKRLLTFCEGRKLSSADAGWNDIVVKDSSDAGATWSAMRIVYGESTPQKHVVIGNPAPVALHTTPGKVVLVFCRNNKDVLVTTSLDFGQTWDKPRALPAASPIWGKNGTWPWYATGPPQGLQLPSGRLLVAADHRGFPASNHALVYSHSLVSDDEGVTFALGDSIKGGNECQAAALPNDTATAAAGHAPGTVLMHMRNPRGQRLVSYSTPNAANGSVGIHWSEPQLVTVGGLTKYAGGTCEGSTISLGGKTLLFSTPLHATERANMTVLQSQTAGLSWEVLENIDPGAGAYSALIELNGTHAGLVYESGGYGALTFRTIAVP